MAASIQSMFHVEPTLIEGSNGVFDVEVDGRLIFSKHRTGRHAEPGEIEALIKKHLKT